MPVLSDVKVDIAPPVPKRESVTLDMSGVRYAVTSPRNVVWAVFGLHSHAAAYHARNPEAVGLRIIDLTNGNDVTASL
jgi:hypothetical protein